MIAQIVFIHRQMAFAVQIKQTLERTGSYQVRAFTTLDGAAEQLARQPHTATVAVVDFLLPEGGPEVVRRLRQLQPELAIIATPRQPAAVVQELGLQGTLPATFQPRDLIPVIHRALETRRVNRSPRPPRTPATEPFAPLDGGLPGSAPRPGEITPDPAQSLGTRPSSGRAPEAAGYTPLDRVLNDPPIPPPSIFEEPDILIEPELPPDGTPTFGRDFGRGISFEDLFDEANTPVPGESARPVILPLIPAPPVDLPEADDAPSFADVLGAIAPDDAKRRATDEFATLVNSMRPPTADRPPLTARQQPVEFTLSSGMDDLLAEIQQSRQKTEQLTDRLPNIDQEAFRKLTEDEPPAPEAAEGGTISDLVSSITDPGFQHVMATLRGEAPPRSEDAPAVSESVRYGSSELQEAFASYYESVPEALTTLEARAASRAVSIEQEVDEVLAAVEAQMMAQPPTPTPAELDTPARLILELEGTIAPDRPLDDFTISELITSIERQIPAHRPQVQPLPSWVEELRSAQQGKPDKNRKGKRGRKGTERPTPSIASAPFPVPSAAPEVPAAPPDLPEFTPSALPSPADMYEFDTTQFLAGLVPPAAPPAPPIADEEPDASDLTTMQQDGGYIADAAALDTLPLPGGTVPAPPDALPEDAFDWDAAPTLITTEPPLTEADTSEQTPAVLDDDDDFAPFTAPQPAPVGTLPVSDNPLIAQLSLSLMNVSLESIVEAALLAQDGAIIAFAGTMAAEDVDALRGLHDHWDIPIGGGVKMKFLTLPSNGRDYMLYGRRTDDGLTLWLIVPGSTHITDINRQSKRLIAALRTVPPPEPVPLLTTDPSILPDAASPDAPAIARSPFAYVWALRDPDATLPPVIGQAIAAGLTVQLRELAWQIEDVQVREDHVYLLANVPDDAPPYDVIRDLKRRSAEIAARQNRRLDPAALWADSYLIVTPGRPVDMDEIAFYIQFERMQ